MVTTFIIGKRSYISSKLKNFFLNCHVVSINELPRLNKMIKKKTSINIIYNHSFPISKLNTSKNYSDIIEKNVISLNFFINYILKHNIKIRTFLFSSSSSVYGINIKKDKVDMNNNMNIYAGSKLLMEKLLISQKKNLKCKIIIARIFNIYGMGEQNSIISKIINLKKNKKKIKIYSKSSSYRDFIHIDDLITIYKYLIKKNLSGIYDVGSGRSTNVKKLIYRYFKKKEINRVYKDKIFHEIKFSRAKTNYLKPIKSKLLLLNPSKYIDNLLFNEK